MPREWAEGYAALLTMPRPDAIPAGRWQQLLDDGGCFLDAWADKAAALNWDALATFGISPAAPEHRLDMQGLVPSLCGRRVVALTADAATIQADRHATLRVFRRAEAGAVPLWQL